MTAPFDPYYRWLGIQPEEQPPDQYRLLGLARFEDDTSDFLQAIAGEYNDLPRGLMRIVVLAGAILVPLLCILAVVLWMTSSTSDSAGLMVTSSDSTPRATTSTRSTMIPAGAQTLPREITNSIGMKLKLIPAGEFLMGSSPTEAGRAKEEHQHRAQITQSFYMATTEVTQDQWQAVMKTTPWHRRLYVKEGNNFPATNVSWEDAVVFQPAELFFQNVPVQEQQGGQRLVLSRAAHVSFHCEMRQKRPTSCLPIAIFCINLQIPPGGKSVT